MFGSTGDGGWRRLATWSLGVVLLIVVAFYGGRALFSKAHGSAGWWYTLSAPKKRC
jgi:hypothetical protein